MSSRTTIHYSVIVPAYLKGNGNLRPLVTRIFNALRQYNSPVPAEQVEVIIVDDNSRNGFAENVQVLQHEGYNVCIIVRTTERGLGSAVAATGEGVPRGCRRQHAVHGRRLAGA